MHSFCVSRAHVGCASHCRRVHSQVRGETISMRSVMRLLLLLVGLLLLVPFLYVSGYELLVLRRSDVMAGIRPLAVMPIGDLSPSKEVTMEFTVPSDRQWERLREAFGTPMLLVAAVNARLGVPGFHRAYQSGELHLAIHVRSI